MITENALQLVARQVYTLPAHLAGSELQVEWAENNSREEDRTMHSLHKVPPEDGGELYGYVIKGTDSEDEGAVSNHFYNTAGEYIQELEWMVVEVTNWTFA